MISTEKKSHGESKAKHISHCPTNKKERSKHGKNILDFLSPLGQFSLEK